MRGGYVDLVRDTKVLQCFACFLHDFKIGVTAHDD